MNRSIGRRLLAGMALIAVSTTACSAAHDRSASVTTIGQDAERNSPALSQQQLEDAVVDGRDLPGVQVDAIGAGTKGVGNGSVTAARRTNASPSLCAPVSAAVEGTSAYAPVASVRRVAGTKGHSLILTLVSYRSADASQVMRELRTSLKTCMGYQAGTGAMTMSYDDVEAIKAPQQGDEGLAFCLKWVLDPGTDGLKSPVSVAILRHGSTLAIYKAVSTTPQVPASVPSDLVHAQSKALNAAYDALLKSR